MARGKKEYTPPEGESDVTGWLRWRESKHGEFLAGKLSGDDLAALADDFPDGCDLMVVENPKAGQKIGRGKDAGTQADMIMRVKEPWQGEKEGSNQRSGKSRGSRRSSGRRSESA